MSDSIFGNCIHWPQGDSGKTYFAGWCRDSVDSISGCSLKTLSAVASIPITDIPIDMYDDAVSRI